MNEAAFVRHVDGSSKSLNERLQTNLVFDSEGGRRAHKAAKHELEILLDSKREDELFEAYDTFFDLLVENLITEHAFSNLRAGSAALDSAATLHDLVQCCGNILAPMIILDDWFRSFVFSMTETVVPSFFENNNVDAVRVLCRLIQANPEQARDWRSRLGYQPL